MNPDMHTSEEANMNTTKLLYATIDAMVWTEEWCRIARELQASGQEIIDEGWMVGWFANAMAVAEQHLKGQSDD
jgi:hypothetical protein